MSISVNILLKNNIYNPDKHNSVYREVTCKAEKKETVEHKLKILKQELKHIIDKLTDWNDFVFADSLLHFGTITESNAQTTHAEEKSARVVLSFQNQFL